MKSDVIHRAGRRRTDFPMRLGLAFADTARPASILVVGSPRTVPVALDAALAAEGLVVSRADVASAADTARQGRRARADLMIVDADDHRSLALIGSLRRLDPSLAAVVWSRAPSARFERAAARHGAHLVLAPPVHARAVRAIREQLDRFEPVRAARAPAPRTKALPGLGVPRSPALLRGSLLAVHGPGEFDLSAPLRADDASWSVTPSLTFVVLPGLDVSAARAVASRMLGAGQHLAPGRRRIGFACSGARAVELASLVAAASRSLGIDTPLAPAGRGSRTAFW